MGRVCKEDLVLESGRWFIQTKEGGKILLPPEKKPLRLHHQGGGVFRRTGEIDERPCAERRHGLTILCRLAKHRQRHLIKWWAVCPEALVGADRFRLLANGRSRPRLHNRWRCLRPRSLQLAS